jgi:hypothetical protein
MKHLRRILLAMSLACYAVGGYALAATESSEALPAVEPAPAMPTGMIVITTGGGAGIAETSKSLFGKPSWKMTFREGQEIADKVNARLAEKGYEVESGQPGYRWRVEVDHVGDALAWTPPKQGNEMSRVSAERGGKILLAVFVGAVEMVLTGNVSIAPSIPTDRNLSNNPNIRYVTDEMLTSVPPGATKVALIRVVNEYSRGHQEVLTIGYGPVSEEELRKAAIEAMLELLGFDGKAIDAGEPTRKTIGQVPPDPAESTYTVVDYDSQAGMLRIRDEQGQQDGLKVSDPTDLGIQAGDRVRVRRSLYGASLRKVSAGEI